MPQAGAGGDTVTVQRTTVHNWVEKVFKAFNQTLPTGAKEIAILGVREASIQGTGTAAEMTGANLEAAAQQDQNNVSFTRSARTASIADAATDWDDLLFVVYTDNDARQTQRFDVYRCTIDPARPSSDARAIGTPYLLEGKLYKCRTGPHRGKQALHVFTDAPMVLLAREVTSTTRVFRTLEHAGSRNGMFCATESNDSIHMHYGHDATPVMGTSSRTGQVYAWSEGCTVLKHQYGSDRYTHFRGTFNSAPNKRQIPYLVVSSEYVRLYGEWVRQIDQTPGQDAAPSTVLMTDQLRSPTGYEGRYLPSIMSTEFANAVINESERLSPIAQGPPTARAANLRFSLERALFTVAS